MKMFDHAEAARKQALKDWSEYVDGIEDRLAQAKERLGDKWLLHPNNRVQKRQFPYGSIR